MSNKTPTCPNCDGTNTAHEFRGTWVCLNCGARVMGRDYKTGDPIYGLTSPVPPVRHAHTPVPWVLQGEGTILHPVTGKSMITKRIETSLGNIEVLDETNEPEENLRLIVAAPKTLAALKGLLSREHCQCNPEPGEACEHVVAAEAAIADAEEDQ